MHKLYGKHTQLSYIISPIIMHLDWLRLRFSTRHHNRCLEIVNNEIAQSNLLILLKCPILNSIKKIILKAFKCPIISAHHFIFCQKKSLLSNTWNLDHTRVTNRCKFHASCCQHRSKSRWISCGILTIIIHITRSSFWFLNKILQL